MKTRRGQVEAPTYLAPYVEARRRHGLGVRSLLWDDRRAQEVRFEAIRRNCPMDGLHVLDVGCGRGDLLTYLRSHAVFPERYTGLEAPNLLGRVARFRGEEGVRFFAEDFVKAPRALMVGADVVVFSGSLNFLPSYQFYKTVKAAWAATGRYLAFNFLDSPLLTDGGWLKWHRRETVLAFAKRSARRVKVDGAYEEGDCTVVMRK